MANVHGVVRSRSVAFTSVRIHGLIARLDNAIWSTGYTQSNELNGR